MLRVALYRNHETVLKKIMPELSLSDVPAGVYYYRDVLDFSVNYQQHDIGVTDRNAVRLLLVARTERLPGPGVLLRIRG